MKTAVILTHNIVGLGGESDHVKVAPGYARNYLFPQRLAVPQTHANKRQIEALQKRRAEREAHEFNTMSELAKGLTTLICVVTVKAGEDGKMFGTVTSGMIADQLKHQFDVSLDKKKIHLEHPIKTLGEYEVELHLHAEVKSTLKVRVESSTPMAAPAEAPATEARRDEVRTEKRGRRFDGDQPVKTYKAEATEPKAKAEKAPRDTKAPKTTRPARTEKPSKAEKPAKTEKAEKTK